MYARALRRGHEFAVVGVAVHQLRPRERLPDDDVHQAVPHPVLHIQPDVVATLHTDGHTHGQAPAPAAAAHRLAHSLHPGGHHLAAVAHLVGVKVEGLIVELQLETVHRVTLQGLLDEVEALVADLLVGEIETGITGPVVVQAGLGADLQSLVVETEV